MVAKYGNRRLVCVEEVRRSAAHAEMYRWTIGLHFINGNPHPRLGHELQKDAFLVKTPSTASQVNNKTNNFLEILLFALIIYFLVSITSLQTGQPAVFSYNRGQETGHHRQHRNNKHNIGSRNNVHTNITTREKITLLVAEPVITTTSRSMPPASFRISVIIRKYSNVIHKIYKHTIIATYRPSSHRCFPLGGGLNRRLPVSALSK